MAGRAEVLRMLAELAKLTTLDEGSPQAFRVRAYENALHGIEAYPGEIAELSKERLIEISGIGGSTADKIIELFQTGRVAKLEKLRDKYPPSFVELTKIPGLGPKTLKLLRSELGVEDLDGLKAAIAAERLRGLPGLGKTTEEKIGRAMERLGLHGKDRRTPLAEALPLARMLASRIGGVAGVEAAVPCGSIRRFSETIGDIDIVVATDDPATVSGFVVAMPEVDEVIGAGDTKTSFLTRDGMQVDVRSVKPDQMGSAMLYFTGSKTHNIALRQRAIDRGLLLSEYGLFQGEEIVASKTEEEIYRALDLEYIPPQLREGAGEVRAAAAGGLPPLVERSDVRGDLHYHSNRSGDGRSSLQDMISAAVSHGYQYIAFTDHGEDLAINGLSRDDMLEHKRAIRELQEQHPEITILFGCELNIGPDGSLDYDAEFRREFDFCVASIHSHFDLGKEQQTARLLTALADRSVNVIGHLSGRYVGRRPGVELDTDSILEALALTGVALEINGALDRLDATTEVNRQAMAGEVSFVIDTDSHHVSELVRMDYGVEYARRAWVTAERVVNTWELDRFLDWVAARRG